jgi:hypothetical protein
MVICAANLSCIFAATFAEWRMGKAMAMVEAKLLGLWAFVTHADFQW